MFPGWKHLVYAKTHQRLMGYWWVLAYTTNYTVTGSATGTDSTTATGTSTTATGAS